MDEEPELSGSMETSCPHCSSRYRVTNEQLEAALGLVKCSICDMVFNGLQSLKSLENELPLAHPNQATLETYLEDEPESWAVDTDMPQLTPELSLHEAMYGHKSNIFSPFSPFFWFIGILLLVATSIAQAIYYQRYELIDRPRFQQQVLALCQLVPCDEAGFASIRQIKLLERNVFTHPVIDNALMVTGSFVNQAPFSQRQPDMLISLFDVQSRLIANRIFEPTEYLPKDKHRANLPSNKPVQFRLEIVDPGTDALTYEFEFF